MKTLSYYDTLGVVTPGALVLIALALVYPDVRQLATSKEFTIGELGLFIVASYVLGQLIQGVGNLLETVYWLTRGGMPTDWIRRGTGGLISKAQRDALLNQLPAKLNLPSPLEMDEMSAGEWRGVTAQMYAALAGSGQARVGRIDTFNGNYGLHRGLACGTLVGLVLIVFQGFLTWWIVAVLLAAFVLSVARMHRFGQHYARELFVQFLDLPIRSGEKPEDARNASGTSAATS